MKKCIVMLILCFYSSMSYSGIRQWLNNSINSVQQIVIAFGDDIELEFGWMAAKEPTKFKKFKNSSDALQKKINQSLTNYEKNNNPQDLFDAENALEQLLKMHDVLISDARKALKEPDFIRLQHSIELRQQRIITVFERLSIKGALEKLWEKYGTPSQQKKLNEKNPYKNKHSKVVQSTTLLPEEIEFLENRKIFLKTGQQKYFGLSLEEDQLKTIGFVGTGGGYRSLTLTLGYLIALEHDSLLHGLSYISALSGSTWLLGPWMYTGGLTRHLKEYMLSLIAQGNFDLNTIAKKMNIKRFINDVVWPKFVFGQPFSLVDIYGGLLAEGLLSRLGNNCQKVSLSSQWNTVKDGSYPFPIYTSVSMHKFENEYRYHWYEFNPLEVRNLEYDLAIPAYSFNWEFNQTKSLFSAPEQSFGYLMGIFGSAYAVNIKDIVRIMFDGADKEEKKEKNPLEKIKYVVTKKLLATLGDVPKVGTVRVAPSQVNNQFHNLMGAYTIGRDLWILHRDYLTYVDAGIDYNIPVRPLFRPERKLNAIIIGESSGNVEAAKDVAKLFADIKRVYNYEYTRVDDQTNLTLRLYKDMEHSEAPLVVYVNFLKDAGVFERAKQDPYLQKLIEDNDLEKFDPVQCVQKDYCNTFNFSYTQKEFLQLCAMAELNMRTNKPAIEQFLKTEMFSQKDVQ